MTQPMTAAELIAQLQKLPPDTVVLTGGYESGLTGLGVGEPFQVQELVGLPEWAGRYLPVEAAEAELAGRGESGWHIMKNTPPPKLVGDPFTAVCLHRIGW